MNTAPIVKGLCTRALFLALAFMLLHLFGLREYTSFLCGTYVTPGATSQLSALVGVMYMLSYIGFVILAPILVMAGGLLRLRDRFAGNPAGPS
jgi:hypothetical protein